MDEMDSMNRKDGMDEVDSEEAKGEVLRFAQNDVAENALGLEHGCYE